MNKAVSDPRQFPWRLDLKSQAIEFACMSREAIAQASFLDHRAPNADAPKTHANISEILKAQTDASKPRPPAYIFHTAFCSSTLISRCLDTPGRALALKEPLALVSLASARRFGGEEAQSTHRQSFKMINGLLARPFEGNERAIIKPSNGANDLLPDVLELEPEAQVLLLYTDLRKFLMSIVKRGQTGRRFIRSLLHHPWGVDPRVRNINAEQALQLTDLQAAVLIWRLQIDAFSKILKKYPAPRVRALNSSAFERDPKAALAAIDAFFELNLGAGRIDDVVNGPLLTRDSKYTDRDYDPEARAHREKILEDVFGADLDNVSKTSKNQSFFSDALIASDLLNRPSA